MEQPFEDMIFVGGGGEVGGRCVIIFVQQSHFFDLTETNFFFFI